MGTGVGCYEGSFYVELSGIATSGDVSLGGMILYYKLKQQGYPFLPDHEYAERIKYVFGIDFNHPEVLNRNNFKCYQDYVVALHSIPDIDNEDDMPGKEFFFSRFNICAVRMPSVLSIEMDKNMNKDDVNVQKVFLVILNKMKDLFK